MIYFVALYIIGFFTMGNIAYMSEKISQKEYNEQKEHFDYQSVYSIDYKFVWGAAVLCPISFIIYINYISKGSGIRTIISFVSTPFKVFNAIRERKLANANDDNRPVENIQPF